MMIFYHILYLQILRDYHLVFADNLMGYLVKIIFSGICYFLMA